MTNKNTIAHCKLCKSRNARIYRHTLKCKSCGCLLYYPYPVITATNSEINRIAKSEYAMSWYSRSAIRNHHNFTNMFEFAVENKTSFYFQKIKILDFGGGGGQFALVVKSFLPNAKVFITDIDDFALLEQYQSVNTQILWDNFNSDDNKFDFIFLNDVFEHVDDPKAVLLLLKQKLAPKGKIFVDTPIQFWLYPFLKWTNRFLYYKLLRGTVSKAHLQIWSKKSFELITKESGLKIEKFSTINEFTMPAEHYLRNFDIHKSFTIKLGRLFYFLAGIFAKNKILALISIK